MKNRYFNLNRNVGKYLRIFYDEVTVLWYVSKCKKNIDNIEAKIDYYICYIKNVQTNFPDIVEEFNFEYSDELRNKLNECNLFIKSISYDDFRGKFYMLSLEEDIYFDYNTFILSNIKKNIYQDIFIVSDN